jgi:voltage-gated potassium channel Kch
LLPGLYRLKDWWVIGPLWAIAFALGFWGFLLCGHSCQIDSVGDAAIKTIGLVRGSGNYSFSKDPAQLVIAQYMLPAVLLISGAQLFLVNLIHDLRVAMARRARDHVIVCGLGDTGRKIVEGLRESGKTVIAITLDTDSAHALACEHLGVTVLKADAMQRGVLKLAGIGRAEAIVAATGSDAQNLEIGLRAAEVLAGNNRKPVTVLAEMRSGWLMDTLAGHRSAVLGGPEVEFQLFNLQINAARALLRTAAFGRALPSAARTPHIAVAGFGGVAHELVRHAICSNFAVPGLRVRFSVFDAIAVEAEALFRQARPGLAGLADFSFHQFVFSATGEWEAVEGELRAAAPDAIVVALGSDEDGLRTALQFRAALDKLDQFATPVFVRLKEQHKLGQFLKAVEARPLLPDRVVAFGEVRELTAPGVLLNHELDIMARAAHEAYLETANARERSPATVPWERLPEGYKAANRSFADHIAATLRFAGHRLVMGCSSVVAFDEQTVEKLAQAEHWRWCTEQRANGWTHGDIRNDVLKQTPLLQDWQDIPEGARKFNRELVARIPQIVARAGAGIKRERVAILNDTESLDAVMAGGPAGAITVLVIDPSREDHWVVAKTAVERGAKIRLLWRGAHVLTQVEQHRDFQTIASSIEGWVFA